MAVRVEATTNTLVVSLAALLYFQQSPIILGKASLFLFIRFHFFYLMESVFVLSHPLKFYTFFFFFGPIHNYLICLFLFYVLNQVVVVVMKEVTIPSEFKDTTFFLFSSRGFM